MPKWKRDMVKLMDDVIADIEADHLPLPIGTNAYVKEVMGASLLGELLMAIMENYRYNITGSNYSKINVSEYGEYYDFLADREKWLLDNPAMLLVTKDPSLLISYAGIYIMTDIGFMRNELTLGIKADDNAADIAYKTWKVLPRDYDAGQHRRLLAMRKDTLLTIADYYQEASRRVTSRYGLKRVGFMQQMVLCQDVFREDGIDEDFNPDLLADYFAAVIPLISHPVVAYHAVDRYRQYVKERELKVVEQKPMTKGDSIFQRIIEPYKGNALFVDFWGMSCGPCRAGMLEEREKVERLKDQPVRFLYICDEKDGPRERAEKWMMENNIRGEHIFVTHEEWQLLSAKFQFNAIPFKIGVAPDGSIITREAVNNYVQEIQE